MARRYSDAAVSEYVEQEQHRRADERMADPSWTVVADEFTDVLGGGTWQRVEAEAV